MKDMNKTEKTELIFVDIFAGKLKTNQ